MMARAQVLACAGWALFFAACKPAPSSPAPIADLNIRIATGAELYELHCAMCHYDGVASGNAPALADSELVRTNPAQVARIILRGQQNQSMVEGRLFQGIMPAQAYLQDGEIADILLYLQKQFGGNGEMVTPEKIAQIRQQK